VGGRPPQIDEIEVVVATLADEGRPSERLGVTHWLGEAATVEETGSA
jgi:hypothetical protein